MSYKPPFEITEEISSLCIEIAEMVGRLSTNASMQSDPVLHRELRIKTIHSSLAIEQNTLTEDQVTAIIEGKRVLGPENEIREVENAQRAYASMPQWNPENLDDLLAAHKTMMDGLRSDAGMFRSKNAGVYEGNRLLHAGTPANYVPEVMADLFEWVSQTTMHPLLVSCIFHYEFEFVHPFSDGNGRTGRLWHTLMLSRWRDVFMWLPVESMIRERQAGYYGALNEANAVGSSTLFVTFMLRVIRDAVIPYGVTQKKKDLVRTKILEYIKAYPNSTIPEVASQVGASKRTVERVIADLKRTGVIRRLGSARSGSWEILDNGSEPFPPPVADSRD